MKTSTTPRQLRNALSLAILLSVICPLARSDDAQTKPNISFRFEVTEESLALWERDRPVLVYNRGPISSPAAPNARSHSSYIHPIYGLDGEVLTDDFPKDHVYHRGLYWAWPHIKISDKEYDTWSLRGIDQKFQRWLTRQSTSDHAMLHVENGWFAGDKQVMREQVSLRVYPAGDTNRSIDVELTWTPTDEPITLSGAPGKSYGGLTFRFGPRSKTIITTPSGRTTEDLVVTKLPWADFSADFKKAGKFSGAAIFIHPNHPDYPPTWMTRHYGVLAVGWPGVTPQTFPPGKSFTCRYRLWIHRGAPDAADIQQAYERYRSAAQ